MLDTSEVIGKFGRYQLILVTITVLRSFPTSWTIGSLDFIASDVPFNCSLPKQYNGSIIKWQEEGLPDPINQCTRFAINSSGFIDKSNIVKCENWEFGTEQATISVVAKWNIVCDRAWMKPAIQSVVFAGAFAGALIVGRLADLYGRKTMFQASTFLVIIVGCSVALSPNFLFFNGARFILAIGIAGLQTTTSNMYTEVALPKDRTWMNIGFSVGAAIPGIIRPILAYHINNWRYYHVAISLSALILVPLMFFVAESPRWLLANKKNVKAKRAIEKICRINKRQLQNSEEIMTLLIEKANLDSKEKRMGLRDIWPHKKLRKNITLLLIYWFLENTMLFGVSYMVTLLKGNFHKNATISSIAQLPTSILGLALVRWAPRRLSSQIILIIVSCASIGQIIISQDTSYWPLILNMICKLTDTTSAIKWIYTMELLPTPARIFGFACCFCMGRIGGMSAPFIRDLGKTYHASTPHIVIAAFGLLGVITIGFLPETLNQNMPDTLTESDHLGRKPKKQTLTERN